MASHYWVKVLEVNYSGGMLMTVPDSLKRIIVQAEIAGKTMEQILDPQPNQIVDFIWDGLDQFGRPVIGAANVHVRVGFVYDAFYYRAGDFARSFGQAGSTVTTIRARQEIYSWQESDIVVCHLRRHLTPMDLILPFIHQVPIDGARAKIGHR